MDIYQKAKQLKEKKREDINKYLTDRVGYEAKDTLKWIQRRENRGYTTKESLREIEKSLNKKNNEDL